LRYRAYARKSLVTARALAAGEAIAEGDVLALRADAIGLPPAERARVVGRRARHALAAYAPLRDEDLA
jgi:sialic acid synthase SpsE